MNNEFTKVPNYFFEHMAKMDRSEQAVVLLIIRKTIGFQKEWDRISHSQFMSEAGLNRPSANKGVKEALERGIIERRETKNSFEYRVCNPQNGSKSEPILDGKADESSSESEPFSGSESEPISENGSKSEPKTVQKVNTQKKERNKNNTSSATQPPADIDEPEKVLTPQQEYFSALCWVIGWDHKTITENQTGQVAQTVGVLQKAGYGKDDLKTFWRDVWEKDWRWQKKRQRPTLTEVRADIGKIKMTEQATAKPVPTYKRMKALN